MKPVLVTPKIIYTHILYNIVFGDTYSIGVVFIVYIKSKLANLVTQISTNIYSI